MLGPGLCCAEQQPEVLQVTLSSSRSPPHPAWASIIHQQRSRRGWEGKGGEGRGWMCCCEDMQGSSASSAPCQCWHLGEQLPGCAPCRLLLGLPPGAAARSAPAELSPLQAEMALPGLSPPGWGGCRSCSQCQAVTVPRPGSVCSARGAVGCSTGRAVLLFALDENGPSPAPAASTAHCSLPRALGWCTLLFLPPPVSF